VKRLRTHWTYHSCGIEGSTLSRGETHFFLTEGLTVEGKPFKDFLDAKNHAEAVDLLNLVRIHPFDDGNGRGRPDPVHRLHCRCRHRHPNHGSGRAGRPGRDPRLTCPGPRIGQAHSASFDHKTAILPAWGLHS
jgi:hypothetical protein